MKYKTIECARCHKTKRHAGRGICTACYAYLKDHNKLDDYPRVMAAPYLNVPCIKCGEMVKIFAHGLCKKCYSKLPRWKEYHADKEREYRISNKETYKKREHERNIRHADKRNAKCREYYKEHRDELCQYQVLWRQNNKEKYEKYWRDSYARKRGAEGKTTMKQWLSIIKYYCPENRCPSCGKAFDSSVQRDKVTLDHVIPLSKGGTHWPYNIQPICYSCNSSKSDDRITDYRWDNGVYAESLMEQSNGN